MSDVAVEYSKIKSVSKRLKTASLPKRKRLPQYITDAVCFSVDEIKMNGRFVNVGNTERGSVWRVSNIQSHFLVAGAASGTYEVKPVDIARQDRDIVNLQSGRSKKTIRAGTLRFGAHWRRV